MAMQMQLYSRALDKCWKSKLLALFKIWDFQTSSGFKDYHIIPLQDQALIFKYYSVPSMQLSGLNKVSVF